MSNRKNILLAPNGKPSNLNEEQYYIVRTPEFKQWFGDWEKLEMAKVKDSAMDEITLANLSKDVSKVVDQNGEPLVVYHGTKTRGEQGIFSIFNLEKSGESNKIAKVGFWFTPIKSFAENFAYNSYWGKDAVFIYHVFLNIKNPKIYITDDSIYGDSYEKLKSDIYAIEGQSQERANIGGIGYALKNEKQTIDSFREELLQEGFDGILIKNTRYDRKEAGGNNDQYVAFFSNNIKLANGNNTTFDGSNPDIRYDDGGEVKSNSFMKWYIDWYKGVSDKMNIAFSLPNAIQPFKEKNAVILDVFEKKNQTINAELYLKKIVEKANEYDVVIYLEPKDKIEQYQKFGFQLTPNKQFMKRLPHFADGGKLFNNGGNMKNIGHGGITYGESHANGGIKVQNKSTGEMLEVEGGEGVVNKRSMASDKMIKLNGKQMSICEAVSKLNEMEGGVKFSCDDVKHKQFIEEMEFGGELERGIRTEKEHIATLIDIYNRKYTPEQATEMIAKDHLKEDPNYYAKLSELEKPTAHKNMVFVDEEDRMMSEMQRNLFERNLIMARGGMASCGCSHHKEYELGGKTDCGCSDYVKSLPRPKLENGAFIDFSGKDLPKFTGDVTNKPTSIGGLIDIKGQAEANKPNEREERNAERFKMVLSRAEELLNKDYLPVLKDSQQTKYLNKYFQPYNTLNLYKLGWRFTINTDAESVGLCEYNRAKDKNKQKRNLYLSYRYIIGDDNFINEMDSVILHEISHAIVAELFFLNEFELDTTQIREVDLKGIVAQFDKFDLIDPQHKETKGHGVTWANVCIALTGGYICRMFYEYAIQNEQINPYMYKCIKCGTEDFGDNRSFAKVCKKCSTSVLIVKHFK